MPLLIISSSSFGALPGEKSQRAAEQSGAEPVPSPGAHIWGLGASTRLHARSSAGSSAKAVGAERVLDFISFLKRLHGGKGNTPLFVEGHGPVRCVKSQRGVAPSCTGLIL